MKVTLIEFGKMNKNGRVYSYPEVLELPKNTVCTLTHLADKYGNAILTPPINGDSTCGTAEISMDYNGIYADVNPYSDNRGRMFEELMMNGCKIVPFGTGNTNENGEISNYALHYVFLTKDPS